MEKKYSFLDDGKKLILVTGHRRENFGSPLERICTSLRRIASAEPAVELLYPVHMNPNIEGPVRAQLNGLRNARLTGTLNYAEFVFLMNRAALILTDSGGIQEEAPSLGKPVFVMRESTERPEALESGNAHLVGTDPDRNCSAVSMLLRDRNEQPAACPMPNPFGDGRAAERIAEIIS